MQANLLPFNIDLLVLTPEKLKGMRPVTDLAIFEPSSRNFHPEGLFSVDIFGKVGDELRNRMLAYIDLKVEILHPVIFKAVVELKQLYGDIMSGSSYAVWDNELKDFVKSSPAEGRTGYYFFTEHFEELQFDQRPSTKREFNIKLMEKYKQRSVISKITVMPAGLRDFEFDDNGKPSEDEINPLYRKVIALSNLILPATLKTSPASVDNTRYNLQIAVCAIYDYIKNLLEGKHKLILGKWATRKIFNSTRNVITSLNNDTDRLDSPISVSTNQTVLGLYQYLKSILPLAIHQIRNGFLTQIFPSNNLPAILVNKKTLKKEMVQIDPSYYDEWMTDEGLEKIITRFGEEDIRHSVLEINKHYFGLLYRGPDMTYRFLQDIDDLPKNRSKEDVKPITFCELLYLSVFEKAHEIPCFVTRYPITGYGSIYPSYVYLKTTVQAEVRRELDSDWQPTEKIAIQFPITSQQFVNSMSPSPSHLGRLGADFDGDMTSAICVYTDNSKAEVKKLLNSRKYYVGSNGRMNFGASTDTIEYVLANITGD